ncbi:hypothetical protein BGX38DRAFT_269224 [Terfezia claveryi]|nr:hypothetical protein BGX38DRAFT_269224 [Terfezia claveryi]
MPHTALRNTYFSTHPRNHLSSPLFFHQPNLPNLPTPPHLGARRLVIVHLSAPAVSLVPCGLAAWGAMLVCIYSVLLGKEEEEGSGGWSAGRRGRGGGADDGRGRSKKHHIECGVDVDLCFFFGGVCWKSKKYHQNWWCSMFKIHTVVLISCMAYRHLGS